jgi:hypothetical protein
MTVVAKVLVNSKLVMGSLTTQYTATGVRAIIDRLTVTNNALAPVEISIFLVPNGGSADGSSRMIDRRELQPRQSYTCPEVCGHVLDSGDQIVTLASVAGAVVMRASGREVT